MLASVSSVQLTIVLLDIFKWEKIPAAWFKNTVRNDYNMCLLRSLVSCRQEANGDVRPPIEPIRGPIIEQAFEEEYGS